MSAVEEEGAGGEPMGGTYRLFRASAEVAEVRWCTSTCKDNQGKHTIVLTSRRRGKGGEMEEWAADKIGAQMYNRKIERLQWQRWGKDRDIMIGTKIKVEERGRKKKKKKANERGR